MRACLLFPGQGFQKFGMLSSLAKAYPEIVLPTLEICDKVLPNLRMSRLLLGQGEETNVDATELAQPLLLAHGVAHYKVWKSQNDGIDVRYGMGHSLGEYTALVASGILPFSNALKLVRRRGEAMRDASQKSPDELGMMTLIKPRQLGPAEWLQLVETETKASGVDVAAFNSPSLIVVSGRLDKLDATAQQIKNSEAMGSKKLRLISKRLPVSGAFHSQYMEPAAPALSQLLESVEWGQVENASFQVISNLTGRPYDSVKEIREACIAALTHPVKWQQSIEYVGSQGVDTFVAMGADIHKLMDKYVSVNSELFS